MSSPQLGRLQKSLRRFQYTRRFKGHDYGMVGFVKQLVDAVGIDDITNAQHGIARDQNLFFSQMNSKVRDLYVGPGVVIVTKAAVV